MIARYIRTSEGRTKLAKSMTIPIRNAGIYGPILQEDYTEEDRQRDAKTLREVLEGSD